MMVWVEGDKLGMLCSAKALNIFKPHLSLGEERRPHTDEKAGPSCRKKTKSNTKQRNAVDSSQGKTCKHATSLHDWHRDN